MIPAILCSHFQAYITVVFNVGHFCYSNIVWWYTSGSTATVATIVAAAVASATAIATHIIAFLDWSLEFGSDQFVGQAGIGSVGQHWSVSVLLYCNVLRV